MNCFNHPDTPAVAFCRTCGKGLCSECRRPAQGTVFCDDHVPAAAMGTATPPPAAPPAPTVHDTSPSLACLLGFIPGVGAIYNGQYAKGLVHAVITGLLISITASPASNGLEPLFGLLITAWWIYMPIEAYHTAKKRQLGEPVDEFSSILDMRGKPGRFPTGAVILIVLGGILLLNTTGLLDFRYWARYWPVILIVAGVYMLWSRMTAPDPHASDRNSERAGDLQ